MTRSNHH